jgi:hypothetical protein
LCVVFLSLFHGEVAIFTLFQCFSAFQHSNRERERERERVFEIGSGLVAQAGLELETLLPLTAEHWDYRHAPPHPAVGTGFSAQYSEPLRMSKC